MKIFNLIACVFTVYLTSGCASISLRENILESERESVNRLSTTEISSGYVLLNARYLGSEAGFGQIGIYEIKYSGVILILTIQKDASGLYFSIDDTTVMTKYDYEFKDLNIYVGRLIGDSIMLGDINGETPQLYIQLDDLNEKYRNIYPVANKRYNSLTGKVYYVWRGRLNVADISVKLKVETGVKILNSIKLSGYLITVPFDVITSPIQFVHFLHKVNRAF